MAKEITIMDVVNLARSIRDKHSKRLGLPFRGVELVSLTSGLDVALTMMEESVGTFQGLSEESARKIIAYFEDESSKSKPKSLKFALWYSTWAEAIKKLFIEATHRKPIE